MSKIIGFHFTLTDQQGNLIHDKNGPPLHILLGAGQILPALETAIKDMAIGGTKTVTIPPHHAYGDIDPALKLKIPRSKFPEDTDLKIGLPFQGGEKDGWPVIFRVVKIDGDYIYADANHELAGLTLHYDIEIAEKRDATAEEISHGHVHVHGPSGNSGCHGH